MVITVDQASMLRLGLSQVGYSINQINAALAETNRKRFQDFFGVSPTVCSTIFYDIQVLNLGQNQIKKPKALHLLMTCYWLKRYSVEPITAVLFKTSEDTVRKRVWMYCRAIQALRRYKVSYHCNLTFVTILSNLVDLDSVKSKCHQPRQSDLSFIG
jgi:hypothetical protein